MKIKERPEDYSQVCVWPGTIVGEEHKDEFVEFFKTEMNTRIIYLEELETLPDKDKYGDVIPDTGGRIDVFFAVHKDDINHFALPRLQMGIRWIEDVFGNMDRKNNVIYPEYLREYCTWDYNVSNVDELIKSKLN